jgi:hypothetical protein
VGDREMLRGALEGRLLALDFSHVEAEEIAAIVLEVVDTPSTTHTTAPRHSGRILSEFLVRQKRREKTP